MGSAVLQIDQMQVVRKKSDSDHSDNDWLIVNWFVGGTHVRTDTEAVYNNTAEPSTILDTGSVVRPITTLIDCGDGELVTAAIVVMNLGSTDFSEQLGSAEQIAKSVSQELTKIYLRVAEEFTRYYPAIPLGGVWAAGIHEVTPMLVDAVGSAWDDVILPVVAEVVKFVRVLAGVPNCNGEVLHDLVVFPPGEPSAPNTWSRTYQASSLMGCGSAAQTIVVYTGSRTLDPRFPDAPAPATTLVPAVGGTPEMWVGAWSDTRSNATVSVTVSRAQSGGLVGQTRLGTPPRYTAEFVEHVDTKAGASYEGSVSGLVPTVQTVADYTGDAFGALKAWADTPTSPAQAGTAVSPSLAGSGLFGPQGSHVGEVSGGATAAAGSVAARSSLAGDADAANAVSQVTHDGDVLDLPSRGARLFLYDVLQQGQPVAKALRYLRFENNQYTLADVMLYRWGAL